MTEYKYDPDKPGITRELFERHQINRARMKAAADAAPQARTMKERGQRGKESESAWQEHAIFFGAFMVAEFFARAGAHHSVATFEKFPRKTALYNQVAERTTEMLRGNPAHGEKKPQKQLLPETVRKMFQRRRALVEAMILERRAAEMGPPNAPGQEDGTINEAQTRLMIELAQQKGPWRGPHGE